MSGHSPTRRGARLQAGDLRLLRGRGPLLRPDRQRPLRPGHLLHHPWFGQKGYWTLQPDDPALYPNIPVDSGHRQDIATYVHYAGALPGTDTTSTAWIAWDQPSTRAWFAEAEWRALDTYFRFQPVP